MQSADCVVFWRARTTAGTVTFFRGRVRWPSRVCSWIRESEDLAKRFAIIALSGIFKLIPLGALRINSNLNDR